MNKVKNIIIVLLALTSAVYIYKYYSFETHIDKMVKSVTVTIPTPQVHYTDMEGVQHIVTKDNLTAYTHAQATRQASFIKPYIDTIARLLDISPDQVVGSTTISMESGAEHIRFLERQVDSLKQVTYIYRDKYLRLAVRTAGLNDTLDKGQFDFSYDADLNIVQYEKRRRILGLPIGTRETFTDISSNDPRTTIKGYSTFTVKQKQPAFGARLQATTTYTPSTNSLSIGPSLRFDIGNNVSLRGTVFYNMQQNAWRPSLSADYSIITF
jgi:hypothetical protein